MLRRVLAGLANSAPDGARRVLLATLSLWAHTSQLTHQFSPRSIEVKLTKKAVGPPPEARGAPAGGGPAPPATPDGSAPPATAFLEVSATAAGMVICHGVPLLGDPLRRSAVDACERLVAGSGLRVPYWVSIPPLLAQQLVAEVTSLKAVAPTLDLATLPVRLCCGALCCRCACD